MGRFDTNTRDFRHQRTAIFDDPGLGYYDEVPVDARLDTSGWQYTKYTPEYWAQYDSLRAEAISRTSATDVNMVMRLDGKFHVQGIAGLRGKVYSEICSDRLDAWRTFIARYIVVTARAA